MDSSSPVSVSDSEDVNRHDALKEPHTESSQYNYDVLENASLDELGMGLTEFLHIQDDQKLPSKSKLGQPSEKCHKSDKPNMEMDDEFEDPDQTQSPNVTTEKCLSKCVTFPCSGKKPSVSVSTDGEDDITAAVSEQSGYESVKPACPRSISLPTPLKPVSAMKGSREKQGTPPTKLTVTWAPDVYDPPPSASTVVRNKEPRAKHDSKKKYDKKNGKSKQKGKHSKGGSSSSKDKKQVRKYGESSSRCYQSVNNLYKVADCNEPCAELGDFDVGRPDSFCGSSFLKSSIAKLHFSIAEAT